jgi:hypothetical protein
MVVQGPIDDLRSNAMGKNLEELFIALVGGEGHAAVALDWI